MSPFEVLELLQIVSDGKDVGPLFFGRLEVGDLVGEADGLEQVLLGLLQTSHLVTLHGLVHGALLFKDAEGVRILLLERAHMANRHHRRRSIGHAPVSRHSSLFPRQVEEADTGLDSRSQMTRQSVGIGRLGGVDVGRVASGASKVIRDVGRHTTRIQLHAPLAEVRVQELVHVLGVVSGTSQLDVGCVLEDPFGPTWLERSIVFSH